MHDWCMIHFVGKLVQHIQKDEVQKRCKYDNGLVSFAPELLLLIDSSESCIGNWREECPYHITCDKVHS